MNYKTAGESHGSGLLAFIENFPAGFTIDVESINAELRRRQGGYGRGGRQAIETDSVEILTGIWRGQTTGAPLTLWIKNKDSRIDSAPEITNPRPGHVDLAGAIKFGLPIRPIMERASARETAARVAAGALAKQFLKSKGITVIGFVRSIGDSDSSLTEFQIQNFNREIDSLDFNELLRRRNRSEFYIVRSDSESEQWEIKLKKLIDKTSEEGDSVGGLIEARAFGVPIGLGSHTQWDQKLDGDIAKSIMSIQAVKGVEIGLGFNVTKITGSKVHDPIEYDISKAGNANRGFVRRTNNAGGIEGGISNGETIVVRCAMKPIPTMRKPLDSIDWNTKQPKQATYERSDVCAVPAASVVVENVLAATLMSAFQIFSDNDNSGNVSNVKYK
ncbi:MAG: chorismate synthase [Planctomycetaceae bacterium]|jgi:chorismate synthase|nr:chorismate synthase [Planctomycetaceae bacterium]